MTDISITTTSYQVEDRSWLMGPHGVGPGDNESITLDVSAFTSGTHYPNGYIKSGEPLARIASSGLYGPYALDSESASIAVDATGGTFTITVEGAATAAIAFNALPAVVQAAIELLPGITPGDVTVTGGPGVAGGGTPYVITWGGRYAGLNAPNFTTGVGSLTGGAATAAVTTTAGGGESPVGVGTGKGLLFSSVKVPNTAVTTIDVGGALVRHGFVKVSKLPRDPGAAFWVDVPNIIRVDN